VAIGLFASGAGSAGSAAVSANGMPSASTNPLYQADTSGGWFLALSLALAMLKTLFPGANPLFGAQ
jgi:hypothetical protein